jgi:hypothetical protein
MAATEQVTAKGKRQMKVAIMQPYFLPYLGYWELLRAADKFVILDDVNFITRGWINRNRIALDGRPVWITIPIIKASQNKLIFELNLSNEGDWRTDLENKVKHSYREAPFRDETTSLFELLVRETKDGLSEYLVSSILKITKHIGIETEIVPSSRCFDKRGLRGQSRIIDICQAMGADEYINLPGGVGLYDRDEFESKGINLRFLRNRAALPQLESGLGPRERLSVIDSLMWNAPDLIKTALSTYEYEE